ncbi:MAG: ACT domain-containing protein [Planctomycetes bacterium]|nr:ACT domain-containing protein [Planctomycetota bacterium]
MTYTIEMRVRRVGGALSRVAELLRRRRFEVARLVARPTGDGGRLDLTVTVTGTGPAGAVARQVSRLEDVERVHLRMTA